MVASISELPSIIGTLVLSTKIRHQHLDRKLEPFFEGLFTKIQNNFRVKQGSYNIWYFRW